MKTTVLQLEEVFTPTHPARATFIERKSVNDKLVKALVTPGKQIVVYGYSGSGKTTLLVNKLDQFYEDHIVTRCTTGMSFEQIMLTAFDELNPFYSAEHTRSQSSRLSSSLTSEYALIKAQISGELSTSKVTKVQRVLPPQLTPQTLARLMGEAKCCWVLEDFHKIDPPEKSKLSQTMKLFMDMSDIYHSVKIIAIGAVDTAREVIEYDSEMHNRVAEIQVPLMTREELNEIVEKGQRLLNFRLRDSVKDKIVVYSNGLASVCHQLCFNICFEAGITETLVRSVKISSSELHNAIRIYLDEASDTVKAAFDKALRQRQSRYQNGRLILTALTRFDQDGATHSQLLAQIRKEEADYPASNLTSYLLQLQTEKKGKLVRHDNASGKYSFADPIFRVFATAAFAANTRQIEAYPYSLEDSDNLIKDFLESTEFQKTVAELAIAIRKINFETMSKQVEKKPKP